MTSLLCAFLLLRSAHQADARLDGSSRKDQAGWISLHLQGRPRDIGFQYGSLAAKEIDDAHRALALTFGQPPYTWEWCRKTARELFWPKLDAEYQDEISGQAEGLLTKGYHYDQWDILAYNAFIELRDYYIPFLQSRKSGDKLGTTRESCSAFIATGTTTKDGKIVMAHNLWWDYLMGQRANVILDITPQKGQRIVMDAFCGFIHSGTDFAVNATGIVMCETTITGIAGFDPKGIPEFMRMRKAIQYGTSLDTVADILKAGNNGGYANTWLIGDTKTSEIGQLELGLKNVDFQKKKDGFFSGSNCPQSPKLISEEMPGGWNTDPMTNGCERRRIRWNTLLTKNKGAVDLDLAQKFLADTYDEVLDKRGASESTLCGVDGVTGAVNAKAIDANLAGRMQFWAKMGITDGSTFTAKKWLDQNAGYDVFRPFFKDIPNQPWTIFPISE